MDRIPTIPAPAVRLHAWYRTAGSLLRELSRAVNQGRSLLRADSGLPVGTHLVLVMATDSLSAPLEVQGVVTSSELRGNRHEMTLRYDFDAGAQRPLLDEALAQLRQQTRRPRRVPRVPLTLSTDGAAVGRGLEVTVTEASRHGARVRLAGTVLPRVEAGSRLLLRHQGRSTSTRRPLSLEIETRWVGRVRRSKGRSVQVVGGRFTRLSDAMKERLRALLRFDDVRPQVSLVAIEPAPVPRAPAKKNKKK